MQYLIFTFFALANPNHDYTIVAKMPSLEMCQAVGKKMTQQYSDVGLFKVKGFECATERPAK